MERAEVETKRRGEEVEVLRWSGRNGGGQSEIEGCRVRHTNAEEMERWRSSFFNGSQGKEEGRRGEEEGDTERER